MAPAALALAVAGAGCIEKASHANGSPHQDTVAVVTALVEERPVDSTLTLTGSLVANRRSLVASDGNGKVLETFVERGSRVRAGDPLIRLDSRGAALTRAEAEAGLDAARIAAERAGRDCARAGELFASQAISRAEYDRATAECSGARAQASAASARRQLAGKALADSTVRAPFAGVVDERVVNVGEFVRAGQPVATVVELDPLRLELSVPEGAIGQIHEGQRVVLEVAAFPGEPFHGELRYLGGAVRRPSRDLIAEAVVDNHDRRLKPGMFAVARLRVGEARLPVIPEAAVRAESDVPRVFVVKDGHAEERLVQLGRRDGGAGGVPVLAGVRKGERIVVELEPELHDGVAVEVR